MRSVLEFLCVLLTVASLQGATLFDFNFAHDDSAPTVLSAAGLNALPAGALGFVTVDAQGHLSVGGQRIRFWGTNLVGGGAFPSPGDAAVAAARLAKLGFNVVRFHHMDNGWGQSIWADPLLDRALDAGRLYRLDEFVDQLRRHGIYTNLNLLVSRPFHPGAELHPSITQISDSKVRAALGFFDPAILQLQKDYARDLLTHVNPFTGRPYTDEPAVAFVEVNNENGLVQAWLSGQLDALPAYYENELKSQWKQWLTLKYGSQAVLAAAWGVTTQPLGSEMLVNGGFTAGVAPWVCQFSGSPTALGNCTVQPDGAGATPVARIAITAVGQQSWHVQLFQGSLSVAAAQPYTLGFWAKADAARTMNVSLMRNYGDYGAAGLNADVNLGTDWQWFQFTFVPPASDANVRINLGGLGLQTGTVWIGSVSLRPGGSVGLYPEEDLDGAGIRVFTHAAGPVFRTAEARRDWLRFLLQTEENYWTAMRDYLKNTLGLKSLLMGTQNFCSTPNVQAAVFDVVDTHYYWKHPVFPGTAWDPVNWYVENKAMEDFPAESSAAALGMQGVLGMPLSCTELNTPYPNTHEAGIFMITAAYAGLQDLDAVYPFAWWGDMNDWGSHNLQDYFTLGYNPVKIAASAAAARTFRRGDFAAAPNLVAVPLNRADEVNQLESAGQAWTLVNAATAGEDPRAALRRRVRLVVEGSSAPGGALAPGASGPYGSSIVAETGELRWESAAPGTGLVTGDSPRTVFVAGFLSGRVVALSAMTVSAGTGLQPGAYGVLSLSSLDALPLSATASALLTVLGTQRNTGSNYYLYPNSPLAFPPALGVDLTLRDQRGGGPVQCEGVGATLTLAWPSADVQVWALHPDGSRAAALPVADNAGRAEIQVGSAWTTLLYEIAVNRPGYSPTPTPSRTPELTPTPSRTLTPTYTVTAVPASVLWEDAESGAAPQPWQAYADTAGGAAILGVAAVSGSAAASGLYAQELRFNSGPATAWGGGFLVNSPYGTRPSLGWRDLRGMQSLSLDLWTDRPGLKVRVTVSEAGNTAAPVQGADGEVWEAANGAWQVLPAGQWVHLDLPLSAFRDKPNWPYSPTSLGNNILDLDALVWVTLEWASNQGSDIRLRVDNVVFHRDLPTPTPTHTVSPTPAPPSSTPTPSFSATPASGPVPSASATRSATPASSPTPALFHDPGGPLKIRALHCAPQPLRRGLGRLYFNLEGGAAAVHWTVYSPAAAVVAAGVWEGPFGTGWFSRLLNLGELPNGIYFVSARAERGGDRSAAALARAYVFK